MKADGFGLFPLKAEGMPAHPDGFGIGYDSGEKFGSDDNYLKQLQAYADWKGYEDTMKTMCSRPHLLSLLKDNNEKK
jgi:predicted glutamine amidotransferase